MSRNTGRAAASADYLDPTGSDELHQGLGNELIAPEYTGKQTTRSFVWLYLRK